MGWHQVCCACAGHCQWQVTRRMVCTWVHWSGATLRFCYPILCDSLFDTALYLLPDPLLR